MNRAAKVAIPVVLAVAAVVVVVRLGQRLPDGPVPVAWDDAACGECRMHVGEPRYAVQLQTKDGDVLDFDDPGCLFRYAARERPRVHAIWFHDSQGAGWLRASEVGFVRAAQTPMDYGLAAVRRGTPGAVSIAEARRIATARRPEAP